MSNRSDDVTAAFPQVTSEIEAAFPGRITRDDTGRLIAIDRRSVTFAETRARRVQIGLVTSGSFGEGEPDEADEARRGGRERPRAGGPPDRPDRQAADPSTESPERDTPGPPNAQQRAAFAELRTRLCADDGLDVLLRLVEAAGRGEDLSATIPGFDAQRFEALLVRVRDENGEVDPERLAALRERICAFDPAALGGAPGEGGPGPQREGFAAFRAIACAEDGEEQLRTLIARIEAGEDVSDSIPGFDPETARFIIDQLRGEDGTISAERLAAARGRFCRDENGEAGKGARPGGGPPAGFNPLARNSFRGYRYFVSLNHTIELENAILIAPGLDPLDQLDGEATSPFGFPRNTSRLEAGLFGQGIGVRLSAQYAGTTRLDGAGPAGALFFGDLATVDIRVFGEVDELLGRDDEWLENLRLSVRMDNVFDGQRRVVDANGVTPLNYQPFLIDPIGRFIGLDIRKLF